MNRKLSLIRNGNGGNSRRLPDPVPAFRAACAADVEEVISGQAERLGLDLVDQVAFRRIVMSRFDRFWSGCLAQIDAISAAGSVAEGTRIISELQASLWREIEAEFNAYAQRAGLGDTQGDGRGSGRLD